jgi:hypothetical protein
MAGQAGGGDLSELSRLAQASQREGGEGVTDQDLICFLREMAARQKELCRTDRSHHLVACAARIESLVALVAAKDEALRKIADYEWGEQRSIALEALDLEAKP